jgi:pimeloyl-ACP methyl ester carboxylesterase
VLTERLVPCGEVALNLATGPANGPPLILLHGVSRRWQDFLTFLPPLACRWQIHALDHRGHGRSDRGSRYRVTDYANDVVGFVRQQAAMPVVLYGHSLGALVAAAVAAEMPRAVRAVILEDPPGPSLLRDLRSTPFDPLFRGLRSFAGDRRTIREIADDLARLPIGERRLAELRDATSLRFSARCLQDLDAAVLSPLIEGRWLEGYDVAAVFRAIRCPVLLMRADPAVGGMLSREEADDLTASVADCTSVDLPGVGHLLHWLATDTVLRYTVGFLESL